MKPTLADLQKQLELCESRIVTRRRQLLETGRDPDRVEEMMAHLIRYRTIIEQEIDKLKLATSASVSA